MKTPKMIVALLASMFLLTVCFTASNAFAQTKYKHPHKILKDCCMMKDGKMMCMKAGKTMPMDKDLTMKNGTKCMTTGDCIMKDGKTMKMKEGECIDMSGKMDNCAMSSKGTIIVKHIIATTYTCTMHPEVTSNKPGKCPKCGMDLVKKK
jgi:hypothetical protein